MTPETQGTARANPFQHVSLSQLKPRVTGCTIVSQSCEKRFGNSGTDITGGVLQAAMASGDSQTCIAVPARHRFCYETHAVSAVDMPAETSK